MSRKGPQVTGRSARVIRMLRRRECPKPEVPVPRTLFGMKQEPV